MVDQGKIQIMFALVRSAVCGTELTKDERDGAQDSFRDLLKLASDHDIAHLVALGLTQTMLVSERKQLVENQMFKAVYRYERIRHEYKNLCEVFEKAKIPFLPLKGAVIRRYYPEAWMRTSCDIDVLVHEEDLEKAKSILTEQYGYTYQKTTPRDVSLFSPSNVHFEMHYNLVEYGVANDSSAVLKKVWDISATREGYSFWYEMPDELFYFYHVAHMAKHVMEGGCGIRPFIDLWILDHIQGADFEKRDVLLDQGKLLKFATVSRKLSRVWFDGEEHDAVSRQMEDYILRGGTYGSNENGIMIRQQKSGGHVRYVMSKIFLSYDVIKFHYPILQKHRWLMPIMQVRRWCKLIFCGHFRRVSRELQYGSSITDEKAAGAQSFLDHMGL